MEHRCSPRRSMSLDVVLNYHSLGLVRGRTRDIGMGGMFVDIGRIRLPMRARVEASVILETAGIGHALQLQGVVVHSGETGIGLMFMDRPADSDDILKQLVHGHYDRAETVGKQHLIH